MYDLDQLTTVEITKKLTNSRNNSGHDIPENLIGDNGNNYRQAGVLIPFLRIEQQWHILFIRRAELEGDRHSGQVAFPGGKYEEQDDDLFATALREAHEEVGIHPQDVNVLGQLGNHHSVSNFRITPVIGTIAWPYSLTLQTSEVGRVFTIPLQWLADPANHELRPWEVAGVQQQVNVAYFNEYDGELLWGATARMTLSLLELLRS